MTSNNEIQNELSALSPTLAAIPATNVFRVPDNYFNELPSSMLQLVQADIIPSFSNIKQSGQSVPEGYFDGLANSILAKIKKESAVSPLEEMQDLSPAIAAIGNENIFRVPSGYFDHVAEEALQNVAPVAKVMEIKKRPAIVKYLAAAAITGILGLSIFNLATKNNHSNGSALTDPLFASADKIVKENSFDAEFSKLSDKDIEQYLKASGQDVNAALVASAADEANLPAAEDYIINDKTLDEFLNKIDVKTSSN